MGWGSSWEVETQILDLTESNIIKYFYFFIYFCTYMTPLSHILTLHILNSKDDNNIAITIIILTVNLSVGSPTNVLSSVLFAFLAFPIRLESLLRSYWRTGFNTYFIADLPVVNSQFLVVRKMLLLHFHSKRKFSLEIGFWISNHFLPALSSLSTSFHAAIYSLIFVLF